MKLNEYVELTGRTDLDYRTAHEFHARLEDWRAQQLLHAALGMMTEVGEFVDQLKKHLMYGKPVDFVNLGEELGDISWYMGRAAEIIQHKTGKTWEDWLETNIQKLKTRYPEKFDENKAINRDLEQERKILES
jgi:NTP pyrophosphatase (non-canonical NTP hydrolase)